MIKMLNNKKSQIGATITWIVAVLVILFIMIIYVLITVGIAAVKGVSEDSVQQSSSEKIVLTEELTAIINSQIGNNKILSDEIKSSLDYYMGNEEIMKYLDENINNLAMKKEFLSEELLVNAKASDEKLMGDAENILDSFCSAYVFQSPNLKIDKSKIDSGGVLTAGFTEEINLKIPYSGQIIEIKYKRAKNC